MADRCSLGHTRRSFECPACAETHDGSPTTVDWWKWFRGRTSSKRIRALVVAEIERRSVAPDHAAPTGDKEEG